MSADVDGYIARPDGEIDWLATGNDTTGNEDYGYREFFDTVDVVVMGRNTYEQVLTFGEWPYGSKPVVVLTGRQSSLPASGTACVEFLSCAPEILVQHLAARGAGHIYIDGGKTIRGFLTAGLVHQLIITRLPLLIGAGIPLFGPLTHDIRLKHINTRQFANGFVQSRYEITR